MAENTNLRQSTYTDYTSSSYYKLKLVDGKVVTVLSPVDPKKKELSLGRMGLLHPGDGILASRLNVSSEVEGMDLRQERGRHRRSHVSCSSIDIEYYMCL